jgi:methyl-accepting chemotaxis protein
MKFPNIFFGKKSNKSWLFTIVVIFLVLSEITAIAAVQISNINYLESLKTIAFEQVVNVRSIKELQIQNWLRINESETSTTFNTLEFRQKLSMIAKNKNNDTDYIKSIADLADRFKDIIVKKEKIDSIVALDNTNQIIVSTEAKLQDTPTRGNSNQSLEDLLSNRLLRNGKTNNLQAEDAKKKTDSYFFISIKDSKPIIVFVNPILDESGNILANILVNTKLDRINAIVLDKIDSSIDADTYLVAKINNRNFIVSKDSQGIKEESEIISGAGVELALRGEKGKAEYKNYLGTFVFGSYSWIENLNVALISETKQKNVSELDNVIFRRALLVSTGLVILISTAFYAIVRYRFKSILTMTDVALAIAKGNLEIKFPVNQRDEIGALAIAFNKMLTKFKTLNKQLAEAEYTFSKNVNQSSEALQNFINNSNEGCAFLDRNGLVLQINSNLANILSVSVSDAIGNQDTSMFPAELSDLISSMRSQNQDISLTEFTTLYKKRYQVKVSNVFNPSSNSSEIMHLLGTIIIVYELNELSSPSYSAREKYFNLSDISKSEVYNKLRNPMTSILGFLKLTHKKLEDVVFPKLNSTDEKDERTIKQINNNFEIMIEEGTQIAIAVENILLEENSEASDLSNDASLSLNRYFMSEVLSQIALETAPLFREKNSSLILDIVHIISAQLDCDREEIKYVFLNLLTRISNLDEFNVAICHARLVGDRIVVTVGELSSLLSHNETMSIINNLYNLIGKSEQTKPPSKDLGLTTIQEILQKYNGSISLEQIDSLRNRYKFYVVNLPNHTNYSLRREYA